MKKFVLGILASIWLGVWTIFAQNILPDSAEIKVKDPVIMWEATNLKITILKNDSVMTTYNGTIRITVTEEDWTKLKDNEYTVPSRWRYTFLWSDLWTKEFQRWLEIKKEWRFYIEVQDLNDNEDKILWRQLINVVRKTTNWEIANIEVLNPISNANIIWEKLDIIWKCPEVPNSEATIYIDEKPVWTTKVQADWSINQTIWSMTEWQHVLLLEIPDLNWNVMWRSDKISFRISPSWEWWIKSVLVEPEKWLMVWDMPEVIVYTDDVIESVKIRLSDRPDNDAIVTERVWNWEFSQRIFLITWWDISLSFDTSAANNTVNQSYDNYKTIHVSNIPVVTWVVAKTNSREQTADISWDVIDGSVVVGYQVKRWIDWTNQSWDARTEKKAYNFKDVPYDTTIKVNITPFRDKSNNKHWAASKTIQFVISKVNSCWNWICDEWETPETCPEDCWPVCWNWICEEWETPETCPEDCSWGKPKSSCVIQNVPVRTTKIWDSYYLIWDKAKDVTKYVVYSSPTPDPKDRTKIYETTDTSYEYPFDYNAKEDTYMYFWVIWICEWEEYDLTWATKVKVWPTENFFLLICLTLLIYAWIKLFRQTEE